VQADLRNSDAARASHEPNREIDAGIQAVASLRLAMPKQDYEGCVLGRALTGRSWRSSANLKLSSVSAGISFFLPR
jgi:hypothetical protein